MNNKFLLLTTIVFFGGTIFFGYHYFKKRVINPDLKPDISKQKCTDCAEYNNVSTDTKLGKLDFNLAQTLAHNFKNQSGALPTDTRSVWFPIETIKQFIYSIENKSCNCSDSLGIRIYFGKYPQQPGWQVFSNDLSELETGVRQKYNGNNAYTSINTLFMVPTIKQAGINQDFDPADVAYGCKGGYDSVRITRYLEVGKKATWRNVLQFQNRVSGATITALTAQNHGEACPPPPNGQACPATGAYFDN
jgi:hypothetical protein